MERLLTAMLFSCILLSAQPPARPWRTALEDIRKNVAMQILRADNYICVQDLSRFYYVTRDDKTPCEQPAHLPEGPPAMKDRLRLDVAVSEGNEIYAWHGEKSFSSRSLMDIVQHGPVSSGGFTGYLRNIFVSAGIEFIHHEPTSGEDGSLYKFDYHVPLKFSRYQIKAGNEMVVVPFHGSFTARVDTLELQSLTVAADIDAIPKNAELCSVQSTVIYELAHISSVDSLIPKSFDIIYGSGKGTITESLGQFTQCRQYAGESTVHFDSQESPIEDSRIDNEAVTLKAGIRFRIALASEIDSNSAYAGMQVEGTLAHPAKLGNGVVVPAGTHAEGLVTRFEISYAPEPQTLLVIEFNRLSTANKTYFFRALHPVDLYQSMHASATMPAGRRMGSRREIYTPIDAPEPGVFTFSKTSVRLDKKFVNEYETISPK